MPSKRITVNCAQCGTPIIRFPSQATSKRVFCSRECSQRAQRRRVACTCFRCGKIFERWESAARNAEKHFCSRTCQAASRSGELNPNWNGGSFVRPDGYVAVRTDGGGYVLEHRLVMEQSLGRYLTKDEVVHHIDGDKERNDIENLQLLTPSEHTLLHLSEIEWSRNHRQCIVCGTVDTPHKGHGMCCQCYQRQRRSRASD